MDERQELNAGRAAMITLGVLTIGALVVLAVEYVTTKTVTNMAAMAVLLGGGVLFSLIQRMQGADAPRSMIGLELPTGASDADKAKRRRAYLLDAAAFGVAMTALAVVGLAMGDPSAVPAIVAGPVGMVLGGLVTFVAAFAFAFAVDHVLGESSSKAVERRLTKLEG